MPRSKFGGTSTDIVVRPYMFGGRRLVSLAAGVDVRFYDAATGGSLITDLRVDGTPSSSVTTDDDGYLPEFEGPDGVLTMWADAGFGRRFLMVTTDVAIDLSAQLSTRIPTSEKGALDGVAELDATGRLAQTIDASKVENPPWGDADQVASYREGEQNTLAGEGSAVGVDPDQTDAAGTDTGGWRNSAFGADTLAANGRGFKNTAIGYGAMRNNVDGYRCTAVGNDALRENVGGVGTDPLSPTDPGARNTAFGDLALVINTTGYANTAVGVNAAQTNDTGNNNTAVGYTAYSGTWNQTTQHHKHASNNTAVGSRALHFTGTDESAADGNTAVGTNALRDNVSGTDNVAVGLDASATTDALTGTVAIGARAVAAHDDAVAIGADTVTTGPSQANIGDRVMEIANFGAVRPGNGPAGSVRLFAFVDGGKVRLEARFPSGNAQLIVAEP